MEYLLILLGFLILAFFLEIKFHIHIYHSRKERLVMTLTIFFIGMVWDYFAVWRQHWVFPGNGLLGVRLWGLPVEEFLFFLIMPYFTLTLYKIFDRKIK